MTTLELRREMSTAKGRLKQKGNRPTEADLQWTIGQPDELPERAQRRPGEIRAVVENAIRESGHARGLSLPVQP